jgi:cell division transport system permease protein
VDLKAMAARARRGFREELRLYLVAVTSLSVAFLCVGGALLATTNLSTVADRWGESGRMSIYLRDGARAEDVSQLKMVLEGLPEVAAVESLSSEEARALFLEQSEVSTDLASLPAEVFPPSLEVAIAEGTPIQRIDAISDRVGRFRAVSDVETYRSFFDQLGSLVSAGTNLALVIGLLVALCVFAVIGNTIRLAVARRRAEIEVMKLCGATDGFVRGPFVLEGTFQGALSAVVAILALGALFATVRGSLDASLAELMGTRVVFLEGWMLFALIAAGAIAGAAGSAMSLRRYLTV